MKVAVMTDSNSGLRQVEGKELGITIVPMPFMIDGEEYFEDINLTQEMFYEKLKSDANVSTSQPAIGVIMSTWDDLLTEYDQIVYIPMSSALSKSYESAARLAETEYKGKVFVVDNKRISVTQKASVFQAIELAKQGLSGEEIHDKLIETSMHASIYIMVDTLKYLKKGGRITPAAAAVGGVLKTLHLPDTIANLTIRNQPSLTDFVLNDSSNLTTLRLENVGSLIDVPNVIKNMKDGSRIRALDIDWEIDSEEELTTLYNKLLKMRGLDENGNNLNTAVLTGRIRVNEKVSDEIVNSMYEAFGDVVIDDGSGTPYIINFLDRDGNSLYVTRVAEGASITDPINNEYSIVTSGISGLFLSLIKKIKDSSFNIFLS